MWAIEAVTDEGEQTKHKSSGDSFHSMTRSKNEVNSLKLAGSITCL